MQEQLRPVCFCFISACRAIPLATRNVLFLDEGRCCFFVCLFLCLLIVLMLIINYAKYCWGECIYSFWDVWNASVSTHSLAIIKPLRMLQETCKILDRSAMAACSRSYVINGPVSRRGNSVIQRFYEKLWLRISVRCYIWPFHLSLNFILIFSCNQVDPRHQPGWVWRWRPVGDYGDHRRARGEP